MIGWYEVACKNHQSRSYYVGKPVEHDAIKFIPKVNFIGFSSNINFAPIILACDEVCKYVHSHFVRSDYINIVACTWSYAHSHTPYYTCTHTHTHMLTYKHLPFSSQVCGGNFKPTVHHLTTLTKTVVLPVTGTTYTATFHGDRVSIHTYVHTYIYTQ